MNEGLKILSPALIHTNTVDNFARFHFVRLQNAFLSNLAYEMDMHIPA